MSARTQDASNRRDVEIAGELATGFADAWNQHDMDALARVFHEDAGFVTVRGTYVRGREEIRRQQAAEHAGPYADSILRAEVVDARGPAPGVIVGHVQSELSVTGQTRRAFVTLVIEQRAELWRISAAHNTIVVPSPAD